MDDSESGDLESNIANIECKESSDDHEPGRRMEEEGVGRCI